MATLEKVLDSSRAAVGTSPGRTWSCGLVGSRTSAGVPTKGALAAFRKALTDEGVRWGRKCVPIPDHHKTWGARVYRRVPLDERTSGDLLVFFGLALGRGTLAQSSCGKVNSKWGQRLGASAEARAEDWPGPVGVSRVSGELAHSLGLLAQASGRCPDPARAQGSRSYECGRWPGINGAGRTRDCAHRLPQQFSQRRPPGPFATNTPRRTQ